MLKKKADVIALIKVIVIGFVVGSILMVIYQYNLTKDYRRVSVDDSFSSKVIYTERLRGDKKIDLDDGQKFILPFADNLNYHNSRLSQLVKNGDLLIKRNGSDTILVKRYSDEYIFVIGKIILTDK